VVSPVVSSLVSSVVSSVESVPLTCALSAISPSET
jgi:hypothetical protein